MYSNKNHLWTLTTQHKFIIFLITIINLLLLYNSNVLAQETDAKYQITLTSRIFTPSPGIEAALKQKAQQQQHVYVQLNKLPSVDEQKQLENNGITLLSYLGGHAYTARLAPRSISRLADLKNIRWVGQIMLQDKLHPQVSADRFDDWARLTNGNVRIRVSFFTGVSEKAANEVLKPYIGKSNQKDVPAIEALGGNIWKLVINPAKISSLASNDLVSFIYQEPRKLEPLNDKTRGVIRSGAVQGGIPPNYTGMTGQGIQVGVMDSGVDQNHDDFSGRILRSSGSGGHGTHVGGTIAASGERSDDEGGLPYQWRGHAPRAEIASYNFSWGRAIYDDAIITHAVDVTNHSHTQTPAPDYSGSSNSVDQVIWDRNLYVAAAAGNNGIQRNNGSPLIGYFSLTGSKAKNTITVGNYETSSGLRDRSSSMGPTFDGRLKPDVMAPGRSIKSTIPGNTYGLSTGTSMASPAVTGTVALMLEKYLSVFGTSTRPLNSTIKAILIHTATDLVQDPAVSGEPNNADTGVPVVYHAGPDWATGYGLIDAYEATRVIADASGYLEDQISSTGQQNNHIINVASGSTQLKITLAWDDFPGSDQTPNTSPKLVNDLDLVLEAPDGSLYYPFVLAPLTPETPIGNVYTGVDPITAANITPATTGVDRLNNVEQVVINNPQAGQWKARVSGFAVAMPTQKYSLVTASTSPPVPTTPWSLSLHLGINAPHGSTGNNLDGSASYAIDIEYMLNNNYAIELVLGRDEFNGKSGNPDIDVTHFTVNGKKYFQPGPTRWLLNLGLGVYDLNPGTSDPGVNLGAGVQMNLNPTFAIEVLYKYHNIFVSGPDFKYSALQLGARWRL